MLNITNHQENENQNYNEIPLPTWLLLNKGEIASIGEDVEKREPLCTVGGNVNSTATMENGMEVLQKVKYRTTIWCSNPTFEFMFGKKKWNHCLEGYLHLHVHCSIICDSQDMEITKMYIYDEKDKEMWKYMCVCVCVCVCVFTCNGILFCYKKEKLLDNMIWPWERWSRWNKSTQKDKYFMFSLRSTV